MLSLLVLSVLLLLVPLLHTEGAKVLLLPLVSSSHTINFAQIGEALLEKGHHVTAYMNGACKSLTYLREVHIELITYTNPVSGCFMEAPHWTNTITDLLGEGEVKPVRLIQVMHQNYLLFKAEVQHALSDQQAIHQMRKMDFDIIIIDGFVFNKHLYAMAHILDKPIVTVVTTFNPSEAGVPTIPSLSPVVTAKMTFSERLKNLGAILAYRFLIPFVLPPCDDNLVVKYANDRPYKSLSQIAGETRVWLVMSDDVIDYAKVTVPSIVNIGGFSTKPASPLTGDLQALANAAGSGLIIVSFGSQFILPNRLIKVLLDSFRGFPQTVIMRHTNISLKNVPANVHIETWLPQNDLLGHPNTCLFITHCGCNGQFEGLYHGVPMLGLPILGDQIHNSKRAEHHGFGITLELVTLSVAELSHGIAKILGDSEYSKRVSHLSAIFRDRPLTPMDTMVYWIERVVKYGCEELRPASVDLPFYQFWALDILGCCVVAVSVLMFVLGRFCRCLWWLCCARKPTFLKASPTTAQKQKARPKYQ